MIRSNSKQEVFTPVRRGLVIAIYLLAIPLLVWGVLRILPTNSNRIADWLPKDFPETKELLFLKEHFGTGAVVVVSWEECAIDNEAVDRLAVRLRQARDFSGVPYFETIGSARDILGKLPPELDRELALDRMEGWLVGPDRKTTCLLGIAARTDGHVPSDMVDCIYAAAEAELAIARDDLHVAGPLVDSVAINRASKQGMIPLTIVSSLVIFALLLLSFRSVLIAVLCYSVAITAQALSLSLLYYTGTYMDSISLLMVSLVFVLGVSGAVHLVNYYRDAVRIGGTKLAAERAVAAGFTPCGLASLTTALGVGSLAVSKIAPIAKFGVYSAATVVLTLGLLFIYVPSVLAACPVSSRGFVGRRRHRGLGRWRGLVRLVCGSYGAILIGSVLVLVVAGYGVTRIETSVRLHDMFGPRAKIIRDYDWIETHIGALIPVEVICVIPAEKTQDPPNPPIPRKVDILEGIELVRAIRQSVAQVDGIAATMAADRFVGPIPTGRSQRYAMRSRLRLHRDDFVERGFLCEREEDSLWRISLRVPAGKRIDFERLIADLREAATKTIAAAGSDATVRITGGVPLVHKAQRQLMTDLIESFVLAFVLIAVVMFLLLRSVWAGLLVMVPNLIPCLIVFGVMGLIGRTIELGTMMTASVALGVAIDDTLHFVTWFRRGAARHGNRRRAVVFAYARCATPMTQTSIICGLGLLVFALSPFVPIAVFSCFMVILLAAALLGDLIILPAILLSPLGKVFVPKTVEEIGETPEPSRDRAGQPSPSARG